MPTPRSFRLRDREIALVIRRSSRATRVGLRIAGHDDSVELVLPRKAQDADGIAFLESKADWVIERLERLPPLMPFADGAVIPLGGLPHRIRHGQGQRQPVRVDDGEIVVAGRPEHLARRLRDWIRGEARRRIEPLAQAKAATIGQQVTRITIRDQKSRWGSCARGGRLSFNWRLVLAPPAVLDYVVAHEVTHLAVPNHSSDFWRVVDRLTDSCQSSRVWLRRHGTRLHRYG